MLKTHACILALICACLTFAVPGCKSQLAQPAADTPTMQKYDYDAAWKAIDSLENKGLYQSALSSTQDLLAAARTESNVPQELKALVYVNKYAAHLNEDGLVEAIGGFENALDRAEGPQRALLYSMTAELYSRYVQANAWKLRDRTDIPGAPGDDIRTWSVRHFIEKINTYYLASVESPELRQLPVEAYALMLTPANTDPLRPTMYDLLAHRAIDYFMQEYSFITEPVYAFQLTELDYLAPAGAFVDRTIDSPDEKSYKRRALELMQDVIAFHIDDTDPVAFVDADLKRLQFVHNQLEHEKKDTAYIDALDQLAARYQDHHVFAEIAYYRAQFYLHRGEGSGAETHKWDLRTAKEICEHAIALYPDSYGAANCRNIIAQLQQQHLNAVTEEVWLPGDNPLVKIDYRNLTRAYLRVVPVQHDDRDRLMDGRTNDQIRDWLLQQPVLQSQSVDLTGTEDLRQHATEAGLAALPLGFYALLVSGDGDFSATDQITAFAFFHVSGIAFWNASGGEDNRFVIVDRASGRPLQNAAVEFYTHTYDTGSRRTVLRQVGRATTPADGVVIAPGTEHSRRSDILLKVTVGDDVLFLQDGFYNYRYHEEPQERSAMHLFTDRAIYRPGQTIHFKGYLIRFDTERMPSSAAIKSVTIKLFDANGQEVEEVELTSNRYGTVSGTFTAPEGRLLGTMRIAGDSPWSGSTSLRVEEYKRPTFEVKIDSSREAFALNDTVHLTGTATTYAGVPLDQATVSYRVVRRTYYPYYPWWMRGRWFPPSGEMEIAFGETQTAQDGSFSFDFFARSDESAAFRFRPEFIFEVEADVTDIAGETRSATKQIILGKTGFRANVSLDEYTDLASLSAIPIRAENLNGEPLGLYGSVQVEKLETPDRPLRERHWEIPDQPVLSTEEYTGRYPAYAIPGQERVDQWATSRNLGSSAFAIEGNDTIDIADLLRGAGAYKLTMHFQTSDEDTLTQTHYVHCFDLEAGVIPAYQLVQRKQSTGAHEPGDVFTHAMYSGQSLHVYQYVERMRERTAGWSQMTTGSTEKTITIRENDRGGLSLQSVLVYDNRLHVSISSVQVPWTNKELHFEYLSYRDVTEPGADEEWHIRISGSKNDAVVAEMLATMYDASLDAFVPHGWKMHLYPTHRSPLNLRGAGFGVAHMRHLSWINHRGYYPTPTRQYRQLNWFNFPFYSGYPVRRGGVVDMQAAPMPMEEAMESGKAAGEADDAALNQESEGDASLKEPESPPEDVQPAVKVRSDLEETVFFFPHVETSPDGTITLKFKMKEALTRWKFLGLAHTDDLQFGFTEQEVVTQKKLMVFPNVPRFLRQKDTIHLSTKVFNATDARVAGTVSLELLDAATGDPLGQRLGIATAKQPFEIDTESSAAFTWEIKVPDDLTVPVTYRFIATTGTFGDGEEGLLPVLSDRIFVTESLAMYVHAESTKVYQFEALQKTGSATLEPHNFTLEFTSNPAWYAVQSLPYLQEYPHACVEQQFSRLYANLLASHITAQFPAIREVYSQWEDDPTGESLMSNLSKNQELKSALLEETPWVRDAMSEEEQMRNIALLFDLERLSRETNKTIQFLQQTQMSNGGFPWFAGGRDNWYITQYLVEGFGHLQKLGAFDPGDYPELRGVLHNAVAYLDARAAEHYAELLRLVKEERAKLEDDNLSHIMTHYLYARSFFKDQPVASDAEKAHVYYLGQSEQYWTERPLYVQALIALSLSRWSDSPEVATMVQSFRERSLYHEELGRYWKANPGYYWYQLPIERQALMVELFDELAEDQRYVDELRLWLLNNKRTNRWESTKATSAAIYALLLHSDSWLDGVPVNITIGGKEVSQESGIAGAEYIKESWSADEITQDFGEIHIDNPNRHVAWGGAYFQYFEDLDKVTSSTETPLKIAKTVWKEVRTDRGPELHTVNGSIPLEVGDKLIVRIELEVDREMEFIHLKDMRGSGLEPLNVLSIYKWQGGLGYYESTGDLATHFFMDRLPRGKWIFEYPLRVTHTGHYANGIATLQSMYAPEFSSHSASVRLTVE